MVDTDSGYAHQMVVTPLAIEQGPDEYLDYVYKSMANAIAHALTDHALAGMEVIEATSEEFDNPRG